MEYHRSVLLNETIDALKIDPDGIYVDCTLGGAGHSFEISRRLSERGRLIGIDQDADAIKEARKKLIDARCQIDLVQKNFSDLQEILSELRINKIHGLLFDLGISSHQIDTPERGFSYIHNAPLDMRMNQSQKFSAADVLNTYTESELTRIFFEYGEERWSKRIAKFICEMRRDKIFQTTFDLVDIICRAIPKDVRRKDPHGSEKRIFQAVRIEVNSELKILEASIESAIDFLNSSGRICVISFHSLEDRIVKHTLKNFSMEKKIKLIGKFIAPSSEEIQENPRSKSAKLRIAEKI
ncbi:MAG: 16S rRNA (cytosine(1402)-N(4))-methyltransferase RsmH [Selenomonadaceae bacterium]|nr:16S rRNA (cytosine(1402)-N(4))-methyltransferase RsmH [Selenomonadaceae bacterium]